jgi:Na+/proline symporter
MTLPLHAVADSGSVALLVLLGLGGLGAAALFGVALATFVRRRSRPYLLLVGAFAALLVRSAVAVGSVLGYVPAASHHLLEHGVDVALVALVVAAVYYARAVSPEVPAS